LKKTTLYVARTDTDGNYRNSAPCINCFNVISQLNIKKIVFTLDNDYKIYKTADYHTDHISHGNRYLQNKGINSIKMKS
tara:strand:+ start:51 stop:287 length:237 start_codon:yes stop_codon:yes gene_type:complete